MGVTLRAEPDHKTLGPRLGGAFKSVMADIKKLDDSTLTFFVDGGKLEVQGHSLAREEVRIMYTFAGDSSKDLAEKYEADSSGEILVLLDTTPDQTMLEEGVAREVINRVQKLRKSAGLKVADKVTMLYTVTPEDHSLNRIIKEHLDYIQTSSKTPFRPLPSPAPSSSLSREEYELKGAKLTLTVTRGFPSDYSDGSSECAPSLPWCNLLLCGSLQPAPHCGTGRAGALLNPPTSLPILLANVEQVFGLYGTKLELYLTFCNTLAYSGILWHTLAYSCILWDTLAYSEILLHTLAYSCILLRTLVYSGILWHTLAYSGILWHTLAKLWHTLAYSGIHWHTLAYSGILWHTLAYSGILGHTLAYFGILLHTLAYSCILWNTLAYSGTLWHTLAYSGILCHI